MDAGCAQSYCSGAIMQHLHLLLHFMEASSLKSVPSNISVQYEEALPTAGAAFGCC